MLVLYSHEFFCLVTTFIGRAELQSSFEFNLEDEKSRFRPVRDLKFYI